MNLDTLDVGDTVYCPSEGWSGEIVRVDENCIGDHLAVLQAHEPCCPKHPFITMIIEAYEGRITSKAGLH